MSTADHTGHLVPAPKVLALHDEDRSRDTLPHVLTFNPKIEESG